MSESGGPNVEALAPLDEALEENRRLQALVDSFGLLNRSLDIDVVLNNTLVRASDLMHAEIASIALINEDRTELVFLESTDPQWDKLKNFSVPLGKGIAGNVATTGATVRVANVQNDPRFYEKIDKQLQQKTETYICTPLIADGVVVGTMQFMNRVDRRPFTLQDEKLVEGFARQAALAIQNAKLHQIALKQKAIDAEMVLCAEIQRKLFPTALPALAGYEFYGASAPAREVGGDYYGFVPRANGALDAVVADVSGKGISASMMVSEFHSACHLLGLAYPDLASLTLALNRHLAESLVTGRFITAFFGRLRPGEVEFEYVLAGHNPPLLIAPDGAVRELERSGPVLGLGPHLKFEARRARLEPGELLVAFSDGYPEVHNAAGDLFSEERLYPLLAELRALPLAEIHRRLDDAVDEFREGHPFPDDRTLLIVRRT